MPRYRDLVRPSAPEVSNETGRVAVDGALQRDDSTEDSMRQMRLTRDMIGLVLVLIGGCASPPGSTGSVEGTAPVGSPTTIWDGVYTTAQADRGERIASGNCFSCHTAGEWSNPRIMNPAPDQRLGNLFQMISRSMPMDSPGRLSGDEYVDVIAYMLKLQGAPPGDHELPSEIDQLDQILVTSRSGS